MSSLKLIAWDTSSKVGALAAVEWVPAKGVSSPTVRLVAELQINVDSAHSERLLWGVDQVLLSAKWKIADVDVFGVGLGPGSFTGLRIGITTARTLAHILNKPLIGVSSLAALARPVAQWFSLQKVSPLVVAATDACKGELFALFGSARSVNDCVVKADGDSAGVWKTGVEEKVFAPEDLIKALKKRLVRGSTKKSDAASCRWIVVGEGRNRYQDYWERLSKKDRIMIPFPFIDHIQGRYVALLAWEAFQAGIQRDPLTVHPRYLRASDAELKLVAGLLPRGPTRDGGS